MPTAKTETTPTQLKQNPSDPAFWNSEREKLFRFMLPYVRDSIKAGAENSFDDLSSQGDMGIAWDLINENIGPWADKYTSEVVAQISKTSMAGFLEKFEPWVNSGKPLSDLINELKPFYGSIRAKMVAVTETTRAYHSGNVLAWKNSGMVDGWSFHTVEDDRVCPICSPQDGNVYALDDIEHSPPQHVNCRCYSQPHLTEIQDQTAATWSANVADDQWFDIGSTGVNNIRKTTDEMFDDWTHSLSFEQAQSLTTYMNDEAYKLIDDYLAGKADLPDDWEGRDLKEIIKQISSNLTYKLENPTVVWRGIKQEGIFSDLESLVGKTFTDPTFVSTTFNDSVAADYAFAAAGEGDVPLMAKIRVPAGTRGAYMENLTKTYWASSFTPDEFEFLMDKGSKFKVISVSTEKYLGEVVHVVTLELIP